MKTRLQTFLAQSGIASRRASEKLILSGEIKVNGKIACQLGIKIDPEKDSVSHQNKKVQVKRKPSLLYMFHKPKNCITSLKDEKNRETIAAYLPKTTPPLFPIGRLDYHSEGLLLITNNGDWAQKIGHPSYKVKKIYLVKINTILAEYQWQKINRPMIIEKKAHRARFKEIQKLDNKSWLQVELYQGFNLQIKKMLAKIKVSVLKLKRVQIGNISLHNLRVGECQLLSHQQIQSLCKLESKEK